MQQWTAFLKLTALKVKPVLFQHLTDIIFRKSLQNHFQTDYLSQQDGTEGVKLTENERGVLRYVAGYICRHLRQNFRTRESPI